MPEAYFRLDLGRSASYYGLGAAIWNDSERESWQDAIFAVAGPSPGCGGEGEAGGDHRFFG